MPRDFYYRNCVPNLISNVTLALKWLIAIYKYKDSNNFLVFIISFPKTRMNRIERSQSVKKVRDFFFYRWYCIQSRIRYLQLKTMDESSHRGYTANQFHFVETLTVMWFLSYKYTYVHIYTVTFSYKHHIDFWTILSCSGYAVLISLPLYSIAYDAP